MMIIEQSFPAVMVNAKFPRILTSNSNQTANLSETTILTCHVKDLANHHVTWLKYDGQTMTYLPISVGEQVFLSDKRYFVSSYSTESDESFWNLEISNVRQSDEGFYECKISNRHSSVSKKIHLTVQIPMTLEPTRLSVETGAMVELDCTIYNLNTSAISWHFSSVDRTYVYRHHLNEIDERFLFEKNRSKSQLIIRHAKPYHSGLWTCSYHRQRRSAKLSVEKGSLIDRHGCVRKYLMISFYFVSSSMLDGTQRLISNNHSTTISVQWTIRLILFVLFLDRHLTHRI